MMLGTGHGSVTKIYNTCFLLENDGETLLVDTCGSIQIVENLKNLIIYHTEDSHKDKKKLYTKEAKQYFSNNVIVPNDLDVIDLD